MIQVIFFFFLNLTVIIKINLPGGRVVQSANVTAEPEGWRVKGRKGEGETEQSKNRRRQDKVIKDSGGRRGEGRELRPDWTGRGGSEQD